MKNYKFVTTQPVSDHWLNRSALASKICEIAGGYTLINGRGAWVNPKTLAHINGRVDVWEIGIDADRVPEILAAFQRYLTAIGERAAYMVYPDGAASLIFAEDRPMTATERQANA